MRVRRAAVGRPARCVACDRRARRNGVPESVVMRMSGHRIPRGADGDSIVEDENVRNASVDLDRPGPAQPTK